jgi:hypothetical protein
VKSNAQSIAGPTIFLEPLEGRQFFSAHTHHLHTVHHQHHLHMLHHLHHVHFLHKLHVGHILRTTVPAPIVLTAQQKNDWAEIREEFLANRGRVPK